MTINRSSTAMLLGTVVMSLVMLAPATAQDVSPVPAAATPAALSQAPQNARFLENLNAIKQGRTLNLVTQDGHAFGLIASPLDLSHLKTQQGITSAIALPSSYDLRTTGKVTPVEDQGSCGDCWAFATYGSMESNLLPAETWDFSENNLKNLSGFDLGPCAGGNGYMATAYLARWAGPVNASDDPYQPTNVNSSPPGLPIQKHVRDVLIIPQRVNATDNAALKTAVMTYGGVQVDFYYADASYNSATASYYYSTAGTVPNHSVTLAGWNDNYSSTNFSTPPPGNGAFLIKNSWGTGWGQSGYFWISYYDATLAIQDVSFVYNGNESTAEYSRQYEYDPLGWVSSVGYSSATAWFANVFTAVATEQLQAVSFYAASSNSPYVIKVYTDVTAGPTSGTLMEKVSGVLASAGYNSVTLTTPVALTDGMTFSVVVELTTPGYNFPVPFEEAVSDYSSAATGTPGQGYISADGTSWSDITAVQSTASICLKAFTAADAAVLSVAKGHSGDFTQGQTGATYSVAVSNGASAGMTSGAVTVKETAPTGLTLVSMAGTGWACSSNKCTRSDTLDAGASYPSITVTVNVTANAPSSVTNQVSVSGGGSAIASTSDVTTINQVLPSAPTLVGPANAATGVSRTQALSWNAASNATSYNVYFGTSSSPALATNTTATSYSPGTLAAGTVYYWQIVAENSAGSAGSATWSFTTTAGTLPSAPKLVSPANAATGVLLSPTLSWNSASGATTYGVHFGTSSPPALVTNTTSTSYSPGTLVAGATYYWRIVAKNSAGSAASAIWSFTAQLPPSAPKLVAPTNAATGVSLTPTLSWNAAGGATSYGVHFGTSSPPALVTNTTATSYSPGTLVAGKTYYWRIVAKNSAGSAASAIWSFTAR